MTLSTPELQILETILGVNTPKNGSATHDSLVIDGIAANYTEIALWCDTASEGDIARLAFPLDPVELYRYLQIIDSQTWIAEYFKKIDEGSVVLVDKTPGVPYTLAEIRILSKQFLGRLIEVGRDVNLQNKSLQELVLELYALRNESFDLIQGIILLAETDGIFSTVSANRLRIEASGTQINPLTQQPFKRWEAMGLTMAPTALEVEQVLSTLALAPVV